MTTIKCDSGVRLLATAVVKMAVYDYMYGLCTKEDADFLTAKAFLNSDRLSTYTNVSGKILTKKAEDICREYAYDYDNAIKACRLFSSSGTEDI